MARPTSLLRGLRDSGALKGVAVYAALFGLSIALISGLWNRPLLVAAGLAVLNGGMLLYWNRPMDWAAFFLGAILGSAGEFVAVGYGAWTYTEPLIRIPIWLPLAWGGATLYLLRAAEALGRGSEE